MHKKPGTIGTQTAEYTTETDLIRCILEGCSNRQESTGQWLVAQYRGTNRSRSKNDSRPLFQYDKPVKGEVRVGREVSHRYMRFLWQE